MRTHRRRTSYTAIVVFVTPLLLFFLLLGPSIIISQRTQFDWTAFATLGQWVGAFVQSLIASIAALITYVAYRKSNTSSRIQIIADMNSSFNQWTEFVCNDKGRHDYFSSIQDPVLGSFSNDSIFYYYLNSINNMYVGYLDGLIDKTHIDILMRDFTETTKNLTTENVIVLLNRGYSSEFANFVLSYRRI